MAFFYFQPVSTLSIIHGREVDEWLIFSRLNQLNGINLG